jgi:GAF domain-containing protein
MTDLFSSLLPAAEWADRPSRKAAVAGEAGMATLVDLCRLGVGDADLATLLRRIAGLICEGLPGVDAASVTLGSPARPDMLVSSSVVAQAGDGLQHLADAGPLFDAYRDGEPVGTTDLAHDARWCSISRFHSTSRPRSCLATPLVVSGTTAGVLALYGNGVVEPDEAGERVGPYVATAETFVRDSRMVEASLLERDQLREALSSRAVIDQAKGMVMLMRRCDADEAFAFLVRMSGTSNRKVRDIARDLVDRAVDGFPFEIDQVPPSG